MTSKQIENALLVLITFLLVLAVYVILYHPDWLMWLLTYKG